MLLSLAKCSPAASPDRATRPSARSSPFRRLAAHIIATTVGRRSHVPPVTGRLSVSNRSASPQSQRPSILVRFACPQCPRKSDLAPLRSRPANSDRRSNVGADRVFGRDRRLGSRLWTAALKTIAYGKDKEGEDDQAKRAA